MDARQMILIHKSLETSNHLTAHDAARIALALELLEASHWRLVAAIENAAGHTQWAAENLARAEAAAPRTTNILGHDEPAETPEVLDARAHVERYESEWWEIKAQIDAVAKDLQASIDPVAAAVRAESQIIS